MKLEPRAVSISILTMKPDLTAIPDADHRLNAHFDKTHTGGRVYLRSNSRVKRAGWCVECKEEIADCSCGYDGPPPFWAEP